MNSKRQRDRRQSSSLGRVIATRVLREEGHPKRKIVISIGTPRPDPGSKDSDTWECPFLIKGLGESTAQRGSGVDAIQALITAIQGIRVSLEKSGRKLFWLDPNTGPDIPLYFPPSFGKQYEERLRLAIERETVRAWRAIIKTRRSRIRAQETKLRQQGMSPAKIARLVVEGNRRLDEWEASINILKPGWNRP